MWILIIARLISYRALSSKDISASMAIRIVKGEKADLFSDGLRVGLVREFLLLRTGEPDLDVEVLRLCSMRHRSDLRRFLASIAVLASVAPLLGLLGTVLGMIETFDVISLFGTSNAKAMAGGISVALVTTQTGLLVAIPGLFLTGVMRRQSKRFETRLDELTTILTRIIKRPQPVAEGVGA
jgi:biopolymer transport protein ExbB